MSPNLAGARWRVSARTNGANTCVEASTNGAVVLVRNSTDPGGLTLTVGVADWLVLLDGLAAGRLTRSELNQPWKAGNLLVREADDGMIELSDAKAPATRTTVRYTYAEWDVFVAGVTHDGEFTIDWLLDGSAYEHV